MRGDMTVCTSSWNIAKITVIYAAKWNNQSLLQWLCSVMSCSLTSAKWTLMWCNRNKLERRTKDGGSKERKFKRLLLDFRTHWFSLVPFNPKHKIKLLACQLFTGNKMSIRIIDARLPSSNVVELACFWAFPVSVRSEPFWYIFHK